MFVNWKLMHDSLSRLMLENCRTVPQLQRETEMGLLSTPSTLTALPHHKVASTLPKEGAQRRYVSSDY